MSQSSTPLLREINLDFDIDSLREAIKNTDIGEGSYLNPIPLDAFVVNDIKSFFNIEEGNGFGVFMNFQDVEFQPKCHYLKLQNRNKYQEHIMTLDDWKKYFHVEGHSKIICAPDGSLFLKPQIDNGVQSFEILSKEGNTSATNKNTYISYTVVLSFFIEDKTYYFKIDPLVKISSKHGGVNLN
ncbi:hypothetical protein [uncultured Psychroserpens sp.]|uniref:hypothetical protein n=1 Tax=uncultured Psychroserpens sp. TaxID=255436 RepID=UPI0026025CE4|nr:hypothetical protein [uncultured Psychroserpens sp.]